MNTDKEKIIVRLLNLLKQRGIETFLVTNPININYLTNFRSDATGYLIITQKTAPQYVINFLYEYEAKKLISSGISVKRESILTFLKKFLIKTKTKKIGIESQHMSAQEYTQIQKTLNNLDISIIPTCNLIEELRVVKTATEIKKIKQAVTISLDAFNFIRQIYQPYMSEKTLNIQVDSFLKLQGDNELAFPTIIASGKNSAYPHHFPKEDKIKSPLLVDLGAKYDGYCADLTRIFFWGKMPHSYKKLYNLVLKATQASIKKIRDGVEAYEVDKAARDIIDKAGYLKFFGHGTGHGVGLSVHELPSIAPKNQTILKEGMVITIEPGIYFNNKYGVRIENMVLVKSRKSEVLSEHIN